MPKIVFILLMGVYFFRQSVIARRLVRLHDLLPSRSSRGGQSPPWRSHVIVSKLLCSMRSLAMANKIMTLAINKKMSTRHNNIYGIICLVIIYLFSVVPCRASYYELAVKELTWVRSASLWAEEVQDTPWPTTVITQEELERFGWQNIRDVLEYQPSFYLVQDVNERVIAHRGVFRTNTSHLLFLENEIRLTIPDFHSFINDYDYPLTDIRQIEIVRGPASSLYGTSAFTGLINVERKPPQGHGTLFLEGGEYQQELIDLSVKKDQFYLLGHFWNRRGPKAHIEADKDYAIPPASGEQYIHPAPDNYALLGHWGKDTEQGLFWWHFKHQYQTPRGKYGQVLLPEDHSPFGSWEKANLDLVAYKAQWGDHIVLKLQPSIRHFHLHSPQILYTARESKGPVYLDIKMDSWGYGLNFWLDIPNHILLGGEIDVEDIKGYTISSLSSSGLAKEKIIPPDKYNIGLFAQYKYMLKSFLLNIGTRIDYYEDFGSYLSPRISLIKKIKQNYYLKIAYGEAFKAPPIFYKMANPLLGYGATDNLYPEKLKNITISWTYYQNSRNYLRILGYYQKLKDQIIYDPTMGTFSNKGNYQLLGTEIEGKYHTKNSIAFFNYSQYFTIRNANIPCVLGNYICSIPRWMLKGGVSQKLPLPINTFGALLIRAYGKTIHHSGNTIPSYVLIDANINFNIRPKCIFSLKIENILDKKYYRSGSVPPYPWPGRTIYASLKLNF